MTETRVNLGKAEPALYQIVAALDAQATQVLAKAGVAEGLAHLLRLRASQINGCAYCARLHARDALACGESADRLAVLPAWHDTAYFDAKERAALALVEAITRVAEGQVPDAVYAAAAQALAPAEIAAIEWLAVVINARNRIAIASRYAVGPGAI